MISIIRTNRIKVKIDIKREIYRRPQEKKLVQITHSNFHSQAVLNSLALHPTVLDWPQWAAKHYAEIHADLKKRGGQFGAADLMIAAHARAIRDIVITNDVRDFRRVKSLEVDNWNK